MLSFSLRIKNEIFFSSLIFSLFIHARVIHAKEQEHRYNSWIETSDLASCQQKLDGLAHRLSLFFGVEVVQKRCGELVESDDGFGKQKIRSLSVIYRSMKPIALHSVQFGTDSSEMTPGTYIGAFSQLKYCREAASALGKQFSEQTRGPVIDSYCLKGRSLFSENKGGYVLHILGAPSPREAIKNLYVAGIRPHSSLGKIPQEIEEDIVSRVRKQGGTIGKVARGVVWYYATEPAGIRIWPVAGLENDSFCRVQKKNILNSLARLENEGRPSFYCLPDSQGLSSFNGGLAIWSGRRSAALSMLPLETYISSNDCLDDLARLQRNWSGQSSMAELFKETIGIVCVATTGLPKANEIYEAKAIETWR